MTWQIMTIRREPASGPVAARESLRYLPPRHHASAHVPQAAPISVAVVRPRRVAPQ